MAKSIKDLSTSFYNDYVVQGFKYNLQVLPDTLMSATLLFSLLFQSAPFAVLGTAMLALQVLHTGIASFAGTYLPGMEYLPPDSEKCSGRFPGVSYSTVMSMVSKPQYSAHDGWPSYYATFMGFLTGWMGTLPTLYSKELTAAPAKGRAVKAGFVGLVVLTAIVWMYRITSECESFFSVSMGLLAGFAIGISGVLLAAWATDRRATNLLGLPLIRNKAADGKPIYVCERPTRD
jgi:hypothetical protein